jgi:hypothetical protein
MSKPAGLAIVTAIFASVIAASAVEPQTRPKKDDVELVLFYRSETVLPGQGNEFVVKVKNNTSQSLRFIYNSESTLIVGHHQDSTRPKDSWSLELNVQAEGPLPNMDLSGMMLPPKRSEIAPGASELVLFNPSGKYLPAREMKLWAALRSADGKSYFSNEMTLRHPD